MITPKGQEMAAALRRMFSPGEAAELQRLIEGEIERSDVLVEMAEVSGAVGAMAAGVLIGIAIGPRVRQ